MVKELFESNYYFYGVLKEKKNVQGFSRGENKLHIANTHPPPKSSSSNPYPNAKDSEPTIISFKSCVIF